jgi:hypothetical protein
MDPVKSLSAPAKRILAYMASEAERAGQTHYTAEDLREVVIGSGRSAGTTAINQLLLAEMIVHAGPWLCLSRRGTSGP